MIIQISKNDPLCECNGSITIYASYGYPPYTYSINNGVTFKNGPIFTNLCSGSYSVIVVDSSGYTFNSSVDLNQPLSPVKYSLSIDQNTRTISDNGTILSKQTDVFLSVSPELPIGAFITFDLIYTNTLQTSPIFSAASLSINTILYKNNISIPYNLSATSMSSTFNSYPGCQDKELFISTYNEIWSNLEINSTDVYSSTTITTITKNLNIDCYYENNFNTYQISNLRINNCSCCLV